MASLPLPPFTSCMNRTAAKMVRLPEGPGIGWVPLRTSQREGSVMTRPSKLVNPCGRLLPRPILAAFMCSRDTRAGIGRSWMSIAARLAILAALWAQMQSYPPAAFASPFVFGLDNRPQLPISIDPPGFGNGSEDPFGLAPFPTRVGPSPSLNTFSSPLGRTLSDADILTPSPSGLVINTRRPFDTNYVDAISSNRAPINGLRLKLAFSVDRASTGVAPSAVHTQFLLNQQPGDIFLADRVFPAPNQYLGVTTGFGWFGDLSSVGTGSSNSLMLNQSELKLTAGMGPGNYINSTSLAPPIVPGSHDNVDAFDIALVDNTGDLVGDKHMYYSVNPDERILTPTFYLSPADIYHTHPGSTTPTLFATANAMGLHSLFDDLDALDLFDRGTVGVVDPGVDYALFSLAPGSQSLFSHSSLDAADIFFTDFRGSFATFASDADSGLNGTVNPVEIGGDGLGGSGAGVGGTDNVDGASFYPLGDMDWSGGLDLDDVDDFVQGLTRPIDYILGVDHRGYPPVVAGDFTDDMQVDFDDVAPFRNAVQQAAGPAAGQSLSVPEPGRISLTSFVGFALSRRAQRRANRRRDG